MVFFKEKVRGSFAGPFDDLVARLALSTKQVSAVAHPGLPAGPLAGPCKRTHA